MMLTATDRLKMTLKKHALWLALLIAGISVAVYVAVEISELVN
jgi:hypothetical protein